ncbi:FliM/FliN family flagellar motor switch protein [Sodalis sp.]|uniref:FliM/FliN family flagellar motor switch protein n=1 Tax=Sodalis sp. (in: enterobacteria) TaxID=1898979 RepID=UPI003872D6F9
MKAFRLRRLTPADVRCRRLQAAWNAQGMPARLRSPPEGVYLSIGDDRWRGMIDPRQWLAWHSPQLAALAREAISDRQIQALIEAMPQPLSFAPAVLSGQALEIGPLMHYRTGAGPCLYLPAQECPVWLTQFNAPLPPIHAAGLPCLSGVPLVVEWVIGSSLLPAAMRGQLAPGDVLLISRLTRQVKCQGRPIGFYLQQEGKISMKANDNDEGTLAPGHVSLTPDLAFAAADAAAKPGNEHAAGQSHSASRNVTAGHPRECGSYPAASSGLPQTPADSGAAGVPHSDAGGEGPAPAGRTPLSDEGEDPLANLPLTLEFILQRRYLSLGEIQQFSQGKVLELDPEGEKHIEIRANGHLLALGELVQLEGRLGVELMELSLDNRYDR